MSDENERSVASAGSVAGTNDLIDRLSHLSVDVDRWGGKTIGEAISEIARLRLTDEERGAIRRLLHWAHDRPCSELPVDVETDHSIACEAFERLGGGG